jgi:hypothetical protein
MTSISPFGPFRTAPPLREREIQGRAVIEVGGEAVERLRRKG